MRDELKREACRHITVMHRYAIALCRDRVRADDIVQEALAKALSGLGGFRRGAPMRPWLLRVVHNVFVSEARRAGIEPAQFDEESDRAATAPVAEQAIESGRILRLLASLPMDQRSAVTLVCIDDHSYAEAAAVLGIPKGTLMSRLARGRAALRALLDADDHAEAKSRLRIVGGSRT